MLIKKKYYVILFTQWLFAVLCCAHKILAVENKRERAMTFSLSRSIFYSGNFGDTSYYVLEFSQMVSLLARDDVPGSCVFYSHYFLFALE